MLEFIELVKNLSWPVVILGVATLYRVELKESFGRLVSMKYRNFELNFGEDLRVARALVTAPATAAATADPSPVSPTPAATATIPASTTVLKELDFGPSSPAQAPVFAKVGDPGRLGRLAEVSPRAAIAEAWHDVEGAASEAVKSLGLPDSGQALKELSATGALPESTRALGECLRRLRDRVAAEGPMLDAYLDPDQAVLFAGLARSLAEQLRAFARAA